MQKKQKQVIEAYQRVQDFLAAHPAPEGTSYGEPKALLDDVVARLTDHSGDQVAGGRLGRAETQRQRQLKKALRELHLRPISLIAKASLRSAPGIDRALRMPAPQLTTMKLIAEATAMRDAAQLYEPAFVRNGLPADFLARLDAAIETLRQSLLGKARNLGMQVGAKAGLNEELARGRSAVQMLEAIVVPAFANDPDVLAKWRSAKRIRAITGGNTSGAPAAGSSASASSAPPSGASPQQPAA